MGKKRTAQDYNDLAQERGFEWTGTLPKRIVDKTIWICGNNHEFEAAYHKLRQGRGCPYCSRRIKKTRDDYIDMALERNIEWIGTFPDNTHKTTSWKCRNGHTWKASFHNISQGGDCPRCRRVVQANRQRLSSKDYNKIASDNSIQWIGIKVPFRTIDDTLWKCKLGHVWKMSAHSIQSGSSCPVCGHKINGLPVSSQQEEIARLINGVLNYKIGRKAIDIALPTRKIAVEYDAWYWHGKRIKQDLKRAQGLIRLGWKVLTIKSGKDIPSLEQIERHIDKLDAYQYVELIMNDWGVGPCK